MNSAAGSFDAYSGCGLQGTVLRGAFAKELMKSMEKEKETADDLQHDRLRPL